MLFVCSLYGKMLSHCPVQCLYNTYCILSKLAAWRHVILLDNCNDNNNDKIQHDITFIVQNT